MYKMILPNGTTCDMNEDDLHLMADTTFGNIGDLPTPICVVDVDNTLRNHTAREHLLPTVEVINSFGDEPNKAFTPYNDECHTDTPIQQTIDFVKALSQTHHIVLLSSCTSSDHSCLTTFNQMRAYGIPFLALFMRGEDNHLYPVEMKRHFLTETGLTEIASIVTLIDDCPKNCAMFAELGFTSLNVINTHK